jgi:hypothetical protein
LPVTVLSLGHPVGCYNVLSRAESKTVFVWRRGEISMGNKKTIGIALIVIGAVVLVVSLAADAIGIGGAPGFGYKQIIGTVAGVVIAVIGYYYYSRK